MPKVAAAEVISHRKEVLEAMKAQVLLGLESIGQEAEGFAKDECPVDTGHLRNRIAHKVVPDEKAVYIGTNVEYAPYVEFGDKARHNTGKAHFLRDSVTEHTDYYKSIMQAALDAG